jgi:hypothetical protein
VGANTEGPGILLLDDINRADDRILRGLMQLLQNFEMFSWTLPPKWQIVATANPEGGDYSVTPMDAAMLTRLLHVTMVFDVVAWAKWAKEHDVDPRGIDFVLMFPDVLKGERTTPRSLVQFFEQIKDIKDLKKEIDLVAILAQSALDPNAAATFLGYVNSDMEEAMSPEDILMAKDWKKIEKEINKFVIKDKQVRIDRISLLCTKLYLYLTSDEYKYDKMHKENLVNFMISDKLPNDLRLSMHKDLVANASKEVLDILKNPKLATLILGGI